MFTKHQICCIIKLGLANGNPPHFNGADESERYSVSPSWGCLEQPFSV